jgi:hypothetical protein
MISIRNSLIVFVIGTVGMGLSILPAVAYGQTSSNSSSQMNSTMVAPQLLKLGLCEFSPLFNPLTFTPATVIHSHTFTVSGKLIDSLTGNGISGATITFYAAAIPGGSISIPSVHTSILSIPPFNFRGTFHSTATATSQAPATLDVIATAHPTGYLPCAPAFGRASIQ